MSRGRTITVKMWGNGGGADLWCDAAMVDEIRKVDGVCSVDGSISDGVNRKYIIFESYCDARGAQQVLRKVVALGALAKPKTPKFTVRRGGDIPSGVRTGWSHGAIAIFPNH